MHYKSVYSIQRQHKTRKPKKTKPKCIPELFRFWQTTASLVEPKEHSFVCIYFLWQLVTTPIVAAGFKVAFRLVRSPPQQHYALWIPLIHAICLFWNHSSALNISGFFSDSKAASEPATCRAKISNESEWNGVGERHHNEQELLSSHHSSDPSTLQQNQTHMKKWNGRTRCLYFWNRPKSVSNVRYSGRVSLTKSLRCLVDLPVLHSVLLQLCDKWFTLKSAAHINFA